MLAANVIPLPFATLLPPLYPLNTHPCPIFTLAGIVIVVLYASALENGFQYCV